MFSGGDKTNSFKVGGKQVDIIYLGNKEVWNNKIKGTAVVNSHIKGLAGTHSNIDLDTATTTKADAVYEEKVKTQIASKGAWEEENDSEVEVIAPEMRINSMTTNNLFATFSDIKAGDKINFIDAQKAVHPFTLGTVTKKGTSVQGQETESQNFLKTTTTTDFTWTKEANSLPAERADGRIILIKDKAYYFYGYGLTRKYQNTVYVSTVDSHGHLGAWATVTLKNNDMHAKMPIIKTANHLFAFAGNQTANQTNYKASAVINTDGTIGTFVKSAGMPFFFTGQELVITKNKATMFGGKIYTVRGKPTVSTKITINFNPTASSLDTHTEGMQEPVALEVFRVINTGKRIYVLAIYNGKDGYLKDIYSCTHAEFNGSAVVWKKEPDLPKAMGYPAVVVTKTRAFLIGGSGKVGGKYVKFADVYSAPINEDGELGAWTKKTSLPTPSRKGRVLITKSKIYYIGGEDASAVPTIYSSPFDGWDYKAGDALGTQVNTAVINLPLKPISAYKDAGLKLSIKVGSNPYTTLTAKGTTFNGIKFTYKFSSIAKKGRTMQRKVEIATAGTKLLKITTKTIEEGT